MRKTGLTLLFCFASVIAVGATVILFAGKARDSGGPGPYGHRRGAVIAILNGGPAEDLQYYLSEHALDPNSNDLGTSEAPDGMTLLVVAAKHGRVEHLELLLSWGADIDAVDKQGRTALHWAAIEGHWEIVAELCKQGCRRDIADKDQRTAAMYAAESGCEQCLSILAETD